MTTTKAREGKKKRDRSRQESVRLEKKQRLETVLAALDLLQGFRRLPSEIREQAIRKIADRPRVIIPPDAFGSPVLEGVKRQIEDTLKAATMHSENGRAFPMLDFFCVCAALPRGFASVALVPRSAKQRQFIDHAVSRSEDFVRVRLESAVRWLISEVTTDLLWQSRIDSEVLGCIFENPPAAQKIQLNLQRSEPRVIRVEIDGHRRRAFQVGVPKQLNGIEWMKCDGAPFGHGGHPLPVFLQSHALRRLRERLAGTFDTEVALQMGLTCSLLEPTVVERSGEDYLISFHFYGIRVGYLVARVVDEKLLITTFLFLTMQGTPEHRQMKERLRLSRPDIEYQDLDKLATFLTKDVLADDELVKVLEEAGCGSLLDLARDGFPHTEADGRAEELKRFLRISGGNKGPSNK